MTVVLRTPEMDMKKTPILVFLIIYINSVSAGLAIPKPEKLEVDVMEGEVTVLWKHPANAPSNSTYNVEMAKYSEEWAMVASCTGLTMTHCDLTSLIHDYVASYKVRVQLVAGQDELGSRAMRFALNSGNLQPPSFTLSATSSTLTVLVHHKPILRKIFLFGVKYTITLEEREHDFKTQAFLIDDMGKDQRTKTFSSLRWGREYCVSIKVESNAALSISAESPKECLLLPEQEWFITAVSSLSVMGGLALIAIMAGILHCYLRRPEKVPTALKSPVSGWHPLSVGEGTMEVVTDKGWFLSSYRPEVKNCVKDPVTHVTVTEDKDEEDRRTSMDSGVGMESATNSEGSTPMRQEDSGCGSLGGSESSTSSQTDYPLQGERTDSDVARKREDSGVGLGCQLDSSSMDGRDSGSLKEAVAGGNYRCQGTSVQIHVCDDEELFKQMLPDSVLAEVVTGYRAGPQSCICSGAGQCTWCHKEGHHLPEVIKQYRATCIDNGLLSGKCEFVDSYKAALTFPSYPKNTQMDTVMMEGLETTFIQLGETFPLLTALTALPLVEAGHDFNMNTMPLSLCDVQLSTD